MITTFYEFPLLELLQILGVCFLVTGICLVVIMMCLFIVWSLIGDTADPIDKILEVNPNYLKMISIAFFSAIAVLFWLILHKEVTDDIYNDLSKRVTQKQSVVVAQQLYKLAAADGKITNYENAFIEYNDEKARKKLLNEQQESAKRARLEKTVKKIDSVNPS